MEITTYPRPSHNININMALRHGGKRSWDPTLIHVYQIKHVSMT